MTEHVTEALVLRHDDIGDGHVRAALYTRHLGRVNARVTSAKKITSKLIGHLQPLTFAKVRLIEKHGFRIADAIHTHRIPPSPQALSFLQFLSAMTAELQSDPALWNAILKSARALERDTLFSYRPLLNILGFSPQFATCSSCEKETVSYFVPEEQTFLCRACVYKASQHEVVSI